MAKNRILLLGQDRVIFKEAIAAGAITPGHVVSINNANKLVVRPAATKRQPLGVAMNDELFGQGVDTAYATNDTVNYAVLNPGMEFLGLTAAGAVTIVIGDLLKPVNGELVVISNAEEALAVAVAREALTKASGPSARIRAEAL